MNIKLVDSIATIIDSLSPEERELLELKIKLNKQKKENQKTTDKVKNTSLIKIYTEMQ